MVITLLTDFGTQDYFAGAMKGVILSVNPRAIVVDITHEIPPQDTRAAAFTLANYFRTFPPKTVHVAVVDPGVGSDRRAILASAGDYFFLAPDNGLLGFIFSEYETAAAGAGGANSDLRVFELTAEKYFRRPVSRTFHGRDVFAPAAAHLSKGVPPEEFGAEIKDYVRPEAARLKTVSGAETRGEIIHVDRFGNLITSLRAENLPENFVLEVNGRRIEKHQKFYAEAERGEIFSIAGSAGLLEIVAFCASARDLLKAGRGDRVILKSGDGRLAPPRQ